MTAYNGHKNWNAWNVALWISGDESLYRMAKHFKEDFTALARGYYLPCIRGSCTLSLISCLCRTVVPFMQQAVPWYWYFSVPD